RVDLVTGVQTCALPIYIAARARKALPFLRFDRDPYLVIGADGALRWIIDGYTSSDRYPYAQPLSDGTTYMRNSVKLVIDAYNGKIGRASCRDTHTESGE